jgi:putative transposon-encoded protein
MKSKNKESFASQGHGRNVKFEVYGIEMFEKTVTRSGHSGRVYLPPNWVGNRIKIIRTNLN